MTAVRRGTLFALILLSVTCGRIDRPTAPTPVATPVATITPPSPPAEYPPMRSGATLFEFSGPLSYPVRGFTTTSRYVLYEDGTFTLQYLGFEYPGSYERDDNTIRFLFPGDARWYATGTATFDLLEVRYNDIMEHSDFENAIYTRSR
jgi:hypothetical protein